MCPDAVGCLIGDAARAPLLAPKPEVGSIALPWLQRSSAPEDQISLATDATCTFEGVCSRETTPPHGDSTPLLFSPRSASSRSSSKESCGTVNTSKRRETASGIDLEQAIVEEEGDPGSPMSLASRSHIDAWSDRNETLIFFDWDDTLNPTSYATTQKDGIPELEDEEMWHKHEQAVTEVLRVAACSGHVIILSMAGAGWITDCIDRWMPELHGLFDELDIRVVLAREGVPTLCQREAFAECREPSHFLKRHAMAQVIRDFYGSPSKRSSSACGKARSWKNILSIGDSSAERDALQDLVLSKVQRDRHGKWKECRCKTVKFVPEPGLAQLTAELCQVAHLLPALVHHDGDLNFELDGDDLLEAVPEFGDHPLCRSILRAPRAFSH
mmetsp:Transcript_104471/g.261914  ORF Transcript_104471/g.261914 Transcript_104471/m.261914 type:complete len:385 (-) Transcript_104471:44-1198(-)